MTSECTCVFEREIGCRRIVDCDWGNLKSSEFALKTERSWQVAELNLHDTTQKMSYRYRSQLQFQLFRHRNKLRLDHHPSFLFHET